LNLYTYVRNDPLSTRDLDGHICIPIFGHICSNAKQKPQYYATSKVSPICADGYVTDGNGGCYEGLPREVSAMLSQVYTNTSGLTEAKPLIQGFGLSVVLGTGVGALMTLAPAAAATTLAAGGAIATSAAPAASSFVFYSGPGAGAVAAAWSAANNGIMIESTPFGQAIRNGVMTAEEASEAFAKSASGVAQVFSNNPLTNYGNIWFNYELPALATNPNVTGMVFNAVPQVQ
jgi:hypothetical protein